MSEGMNVGLVGMAAAVAEIGDHLATIRRQSAEITALRASEARLREALTEIGKLTKPEDHPYTALCAIDQLVLVSLHTGENVK